MSGWTVAAVLAGGAIGAPARYLSDRFVAERTDTTFPFETFLINVVGSLLLGLLAGLDLAGHESDSLRFLVGTGFCGAYTTFSTWSFETVELCLDGELRAAAANLAASVLVGLAAAAGGIALGLAIA